MRYGLLLLVSWKERAIIGQLFAILTKCLMPHKNVEGNAVAQIRLLHLIVSRVPHELYALGQVHLR
jgi:hypothetical protein